MTGTDLRKARQVLFGGAAGTAVQVTGRTSLTVVAPAHVAGSVDVVVVTPGGSSPTGPADRYTYADPPGITSRRIEMAAVSCPAPGECRAVGDLIELGGRHRPVVERWSGGTWTATALPLNLMAT